MTTVVVNPLSKKINNSRTSDDINMKLGLITKLDKRKKTTSKKLAMTSCQKIVTPLSVFNLWLIWSNLDARFWTHSL